MNTILLQCHRHGCGAVYQHRSQAQQHHSQYSTLVLVAVPLLLVAALVLVVALFGLLGCFLVKLSASTSAAKTY